MRCRSLLSATAALAVLTALPALAEAPAAPAAEAAPVAAQSAERAFTYNDMLNANRRTDARSSTPCAPRTWRPIAASPACSSRT